MITLQLRQLIIQKSFIAIKSLYGIQEKLKLEGYRNIEYREHHSLISGLFFFKSEKGNYYKIGIDKGDIVSLKKGTIKVTF